MTPEIRDQALSFHASQNPDLVSKALKEIIEQAQQRAAERDSGTEFIRSSTDPQAPPATPSPSSVRARFGRHLSAPTNDASPYAPVSSSPSPSDAEPQRRATEHYADVVVMPVPPRVAPPPPPPSIPSSPASTRSSNLDSPVSTTSRTVDPFSSARRNRRIVTRRSVLGGDTVDEDDAGTIV